MVIYYYNYDIEVTRMSRPARVLSRTGMYHIIFRGINRQNLFEDEKDFSKLLEIADVKEISDIALSVKCVKKSAKNV